MYLFPLPPYGVPFTDHPLMPGPERGRAHPRPHGLELALPCPWSPPLGACLP